VAHPVCHDLGRAVEQLDRLGRLAGVDLVQRTPLVIRAVAGGRLGLPRTVGRSTHGEAVVERSRREVAVAAIPGSAGIAAGPVGRGPGAGDAVQQVGAGQVGRHAGGAYPAQQLPA
jgi:hypothetical protein